VSIRIVTTVRAVVPLDEIYEEDRELEGAYVYDISTPSSVEDARELALDIFHSTIPVECLDAWELETWEVRG